MKPSNAGLYANNNDKPAERRAIKKKENKMEILIKETGAVETLLLIDSKTGCNWFNDLIGNHDGYNDDPEYGFAKEKDEDGLDTGRFVTSQENFEWWQNIVTEMNDLERRIVNLKQEFDYYLVEETVIEAGRGNTDLEYYPSIVHQALDEEFGEGKGR